MKCDICKAIRSIEGFSGYLHYNNTKNKFDEYVSNGVFKMSKANHYETIYQCIKCKTKWLLAEPDFPIKGYLVQG